MTRLDELLATPPAERPRKGPRRWEKSAARFSTAYLAWKCVHWLARGHNSSETDAEWTAGWDATWGPAIVTSPRDPLLMNPQRCPITRRWRADVTAWCRQMGEVKLP